MAKGIKIKRVFNGKIYTYHMSVAYGTYKNTKETARETADFLRAKGKLIRIVKVSNGYLLYQRSK